MPNDIKTEPQFSQRASVMPIPEKHLRSCVQVLNRVIVELRKTDMDIRKISFFEDPLEAIVHLNEPKLPRTNLSWPLRLLRPNEKQMSPKRVKLNVTRAPDVQHLFLLKYETLPRGV